MRFAPVAALVLLWAALGGCALPASTAGGEATAPDRERVQVVSVTDGDTIRVRRNGQTVPVRYIGIDTPETDPRRAVECFGAEATAANMRLVEGRTVELEKDVSETDSFDRLLRYVYVDGRLLNEILVSDGFARAV
ncbi:MAG: thermonuclease family protein, partial [Chloroflexi bacterium]|nr:thermonuclease family protein [Chloroflexota bacterium]